MKQVLKFGHFHSRDFPHSHSAQIKLKFYFFAPASLRIARSLIGCISRKTVQRYDIKQTKIPYIGPTDSSYIGDTTTDNQPVTLIIENPVYFLMSCWHGTGLLEIPLLLGQIIDTPKQLKRLPLTVHPHFLSKRLGYIHRLLTGGLGQ